MRSLTALLATILAAPCAFAQVPTPPSAGTAPAATGIAPTTPAAVPVVSPEVHPDGTVTLRLDAPNAQKVTASIEGDAKPVVLQRNANGVWEGTTGPKAPEYYGYSFSVDGKRELDPRNATIRPNLLSPTTVLYVPAATPQPWDITDIPHGEVSHHIYYSKLAAGDGFSDDRDMWVYTPPGYDAKRKEAYPVLYLIHGFSDAANGWVEAGQANLIFDSLLHDGRIKPMVVVMPKGYGTMQMIEAAAAVRPPAISMKNQTTFSDQMLHEIIPMAEARYNIAKDPAHRAMAGLSMGGGHSMYTGLNHPEVFSYVGMFSAGITSGSADIRGKNVDPATYDMAFKGALPHATTQAPVKLLWISCGTEDALITVNHGFENWAKTNIKGNVQVRDTPGMHTWMVWRDDLIAFTPLLFTGSSAQRHGILKERHNRRSFLMPNELPKAYDPAAIEQKWAEFWVREHLFDTPPNSEDDDGEKPFVMLLPPPNVTGRLHMGHMLNQTEMDILARWHRMRGEESVWVPGTDHAGIATQMMVEKQLATEGTNRKELGRDAFLDRVWQWKAQYGGAITTQMKRLGASVDWGREYFTMDDNLSNAVTEAFVRLYEQGLIYKGSYIVNWDPVQQTAVSDLEVEHKEVAGKLYHLRYPFADGSGSIVIATTRPETMLGDVAVVVNPTDERYTAMIGKKILLPLVEREIPLLADNWAKPEFGTGAVKVTPAHDPNDYEIGKRHSLANLTIMDETAHIDLPGSPYHGMARYAAREKIVADLDALGLLVEIKDHTLAIATSQRSGAVIEPRLSMQWFLKIQPLADKAIAAVKDGHIRFTPPMYEKTYLNWMENIHDWCISRQLWWGHRIPAYSCPQCETLCVSRTRPERCGSCDHAEMQQETDALDTWFSAGLLPFTVFGWPEPTSDSAKYYPTDLLVTGFDILFFWVARMIMFGTHFMLDVPMPDGSARTLADAVPFREVYIHALVRDADRQKMSKTKGNVVDPIEIIERFGTDAVRFTLASQASPGTDIAFSEARTEGYRAFANKIWNAARFLFMQVERAQAAGYRMKMGAGTQVTSLPEITPIETRWIFARLRAVCAEADLALADYRFDEAANGVYQFFWGEFCDWYLELVKLRLDFPEIVEGQTPIQNPETAISLAGLVGVFEASLRLLSPFMPFLTEELWHALYEGAPPAKSIALTRFPQAVDFPADDAATAAITTLQELIVTVRALRKELGVPEKEPAAILLHGDNRILALADANRDMLSRMARVSDVEFATEPLTGPAARGGSGFDVSVIYERQIDVPAERERLTKELAKLEKGLQAAGRQLGNEGFLAKAPAAVVDGLKKQQAETQSQYDKAKAALESLPA